MKSEPISGNYFDGSLDSFRVFFKNASNISTSEYTDAGAVVTPGSSDENKITSKAGDIDGSGSVDAIDLGS